MEDGDFLNGYEVSNHFEIVHAGKFTHARVKTERTGLS